MNFSDMLTPFELDNPNVPPLYLGQFVALVAGWAMDLFADWALKS